MKISAPGFLEIAAFILTRSSTLTRPSLIDCILTPTPILREVSCWHRDPSFPICHIRWNHLSPKHLEWSFPFSVIHGPNDQIGTFQNKTCLKSTRMVRSPDQGFSYPGRIWSPRASYWQFAARLHTPSHCGPPYLCISIHESGGADVITIMLV